ncbi:C-C chemokine receptor type 10 [Hypomesus transpacificus]|uniref:C-C chemokine receptor type 10 n=1 Tax=Hypomesus transpacificus TaxID=137520 RepID=UPI001F071F8D|nr:C-C chemokine receptor type 10 [Hypomesus transpacificus]XP_046888453.1 C-C chemokine receptor type 10 [Hypomesus transpacificus]
MSETDDYDYVNSDNVTDFDLYTSDYNVTSTYNDLKELCEARDQQLTIKVFQSCVSILVFLVGIVGNSLVIATFAFYRRLRLRSMTDVFLFNLALADLLLLFTLPLQAGDTLQGWVFGVAFCKATQAIYAINTYSGLLLLACISIDRYLVVGRAQEALRLRKRMLMIGKLASLAVWLAAIVLSLPEIIFSQVQEGLEGEAHCGLKIWKELESWKVKTAIQGAQIAGFCLPFLIMVVCYSLIGWILCEGRAEGRMRGWQRQRTLKLMMALVIVFLLFQLPYTVILSLKMAGPSSTCEQNDSTLLWEYITRTLAYTRCCLNPILYALVGVRFRNDVRKLFHDANCLCGVGLSPHPDTGSSLSPTSTGVTMLSAFSAVSPRSCPIYNQAPVCFSPNLSCHQKTSHQMIVSIPN